MPVATPVTWKELDSIERSDAFSIADAAELLKRANDRKLKAWGVAKQTLPVLR